MFNCLSSDHDLSSTGSPKEVALDPHTIEHMHKQNPLGHISLQMLATLPYHQHPLVT
jgi:hypothetical protein